MDLTHAYPNPSAGVLFPQDTASSRPLFGFHLLAVVKAALENDQGFTMDAVDESVFLSDAP